MPRDYSKTERHGHRAAGYRSPTYCSWEAMTQRCYNNRFVQYSDYGGRGISVCERWERFSLFLEDMGERPEGTTLDRIDTDGNYTPDNCRWANREQQYLTRRTTIQIEVDGEIKSLRHWLVKYRMDPRTYYKRIKSGLTPEQVLKRKEG